MSVVSGYGQGVCEHSDVCLFDGNIVRHVLVSHGDTRFGFGDVDVLSHVESGVIDGLVVFSLDLGGFCEDSGERGECECSTVDHVLGDVSFSSCLLRMRIGKITTMEALSQQKGNSYRIFIGISHIRNRPPISVLHQQPSSSMRHCLHNWPTLPHEMRLIPRDLSL